MAWVSCAQQFTGVIIFQVYIFFQTSKQSLTIVSLTHISFYLLTLPWATLIKLPWCRFAPQQMRSACLRFMLLTSYKKKSPSFILAIAMLMLINLNKSNNLSTLWEHSNMATFLLIGMYQTYTILPHFSDCPNSSLRHIHSRSCSLSSISITIPNSYLVYTSHPI